MIKGLLLSHGHSSQYSKVGRTYSGTMKKFTDDNKTIYIDEGTSFLIAQYEHPNVSE